MAAVFPFFSSTTISTCLAALGTFIRLKCPSCAFLRIWMNVEGFEGSARFPSSSRAAIFYQKVKMKNDSPAARIDLLKKSCSEQSSWNISRNFDWPIISLALSSAVVTIERDWSIRRSIMNLIGRRSVLFWIPGSPSDLSTAHLLFSFLSPIQMLYNWKYRLIYITCKLFQV